MKKSSLMSFISVFLVLTQIISIPLYCAQYSPSDSLEYFNNRSDAYFEEKLEPDNIMAEDYDFLYDYDGEDSDIPLDDPMPEASGSFINENGDNYVYIEPSEEQASPAGISYAGNLLIAVNTYSDYPNEASDIPEKFGIDGLGVTDPNYSTYSDEADPVTIYPDTLTAAMDKAAERGYSVYKQDDEGLYVMEPSFVTGSDLSEAEIQELNNYTDLVDGINYYSVGNTKTITSIGDGFTFTTTVKCLYVGTYCTVWGETSCNSKIQINTAKAKSIGTQFDNNFTKTKNAFGNFRDRDSDGKIALLCYDIDRNYGKDPSTYDLYTSGYFFGSDLYGNNFNKMDCIHIDTFPGMGISGNELNNISKSYSVTAHEFQHLINYSWYLNNISTGIGRMETYLNEAFSMAAEQLVCGNSAVSNRVDEFIYYGGTITKGESLTWDYNFYNNYWRYSLSYIFSQYLRTQYKLYKNTSTGAEIFNLIQSNRYSQKRSNSLDVIYGILGLKTPSTLLFNFYSAITILNSSGVYGFAGESWASNLRSAVSVTGIKVSSNAGYIKAAGARYYYPTSNYNSGGWVSVYDKGSDIKIMQVYQSGVAYETGNTSINGRGPSYALISKEFTNTARGTRLYVSVSNARPTSKNFTSYFTIESNKSHSLEVSTPTAAATTVWYYSQNSDGATSEIRSVSIPAFTGELQISNLRISRSGLFRIELTFTANMTGTLYYSVGYSASSSKSNLNKTASFKSGSNTITVSRFLFKRYITYYFLGSNGSQTILYSKRV